ncbi:hypothetical protein BKA70DRAFT_1445691 [Coprinopsis sp. MPI-PUGE-AT-0042]|nr:hypothetical protein BKA70DRAFT_1445691 [Coprinopsis sp. MPI-PUGE-AT-0042]
MVACRFGNVALNPDMLELLAQTVDANGSMIDLLNYRLVCTATAIAAEGLVFSAITFADRRGFHIGGHVRNYLQLVDHNPLLLKRTRNVQIVANHTTSWIWTTSMLRVITLLAQQGHVTSIAISRRDELAKLASSTLGTFLHTLSTSLTTLDLDAIQFLPPQFFSSFTALRNLSATGVEMDIINAKRSPPRFLPRLTSFLYGARSCRGVYCAESRPDPLLQALDLTGLEIFHCQGTQYERELQMLNEVVPLASQSLKKITIDVTGLFLRWGNAKAELHFPTLPKLRSIHLISVCSSYRPPVGDEWFLGLQQVIDALRGATDVIKMKIEIFLPNIGVAGVHNLESPSLDTSLLRLSERCERVQVDIEVYDPHMNKLLSSSPTSERHALEGISVETLLPMSMACATIHVATHSL